MYVLIESEPISKAIKTTQMLVLLQLLNYHVALIKGADGDQSRSLAKSVTGE